MTNETIHSGFIRIDEAINQNLCVTSTDVKVQFTNHSIYYSIMEKKMCETLGIPLEFLGRESTSSYCENVFKYENYAQSSARLRRRLKNNIFGDTKQFAVSEYTSKLKPKEKWPRMPRKKLMSIKLLNLYKKPETKPNAL
jgi:hypothetical protein